MEEPKIRVGICDGYPEIRGRLNGVYRAGGSPFTGEFVCRPLEGAVVLFDSFGREVLRGAEIRLTAERSGTFTLQEVTIGVRFHWERREGQTFPGDLAFLPAGTGLLAAVNELPVEEYLASVVSSEMSGEAPFAFLKAHAIASRSWLVAMLERRASGREKGGNRETATGRAGEVIRWYDREDHTRFDVCADDHCQRYQGITGGAAGRAAEAVRETRGVFLIHAGAICDARYHKACGGLTENFATCWEEIEVPYLSHVSDSATPHAPVRTEADAERWILSCPDVSCRTNDQALLRRILPAFDRETADFFRWQVSYPREELEAILRSKSGIDFGVLRASCPSNAAPPGGSASFGSRDRRPRWPSGRSWRSAAGSRQAISTAAPSSSVRPETLRGSRPASPSTGRGGDTASASARSGQPSWRSRGAPRKRSSGATSAARRW